jgi:hypothetical protein
MTPFERRDIPYLIVVAIGLVAFMVWAAWYWS